MTFFRINKPVLLIPVLLLFLLPGSCSRTVKGELHFFYLEPCPSCESYEKAEDLAARILKQKDYKTSVSNLLNKDDFLRLGTLIREKKLPDISRSLPLLITSDGYVNGYEDIEKTLDQLP